MIGDFNPAYYVISFYIDCWIYLAWKKLILNPWSIWNIGNFLWFYIFNGCPHKGAKSFKFPVNAQIGFFLRAFLVSVMRSANFGRWPGEASFFADREREKEREIPICAAAAAIIWRPWERFKRNRELFCPIIRRGEFSRIGAACGPSTEWARDGASNINTYTQNKLPKFAGNRLAFDFSRRRNSRCGAGLFVVRV